MHPLIPPPMPTTPATMRSTHHRRAVVVGVDDYPAPYTLAGCVNDARLWAETLRAKGFTVTLLLDAQATRAAIVGAIRDMLAVSAPDDVACLFYSGHGTQVPDADGDEASPLAPADRVDEAICPVDSLTTGAFLVDDDLRALFAAVDPRVRVVAILDSCFSGTATRLLGGNVCPPGMGASARPRFVRLTPAMAAAYRATRAAGARERAGNPAQPSASLRRRVGGPVLREAMHWAQIGACQPTEVSWEGATDDGTVHGYFTAVAAPVLAKAAGNLTRAGFLARVVKAMGPSRSQTPCLDAAPGVERRSVWGATVV